MWLRQARRLSLGIPRQGCGPVCHRQVEVVAASGSLACSLRAMRYLPRSSAIGIAPSRGMEGAHMRAACGYVKRAAHLLAFPCGASRPIRYRQVEVVAASGSLASSLCAAAVEIPGSPATEIASPPGMKMSTHASRMWLRRNAAALRSAFLRARVAGPIRYRQDEVVAASGSLASSLRAER